MRRPSRNHSIDALRGLVIVLMALDHTQYFWLAEGLPNDGLGGTIPQYATAFHQFTRFVSHICAPTFLFLAGMMLFGKTNRRQLVIRALLLIALQFTLENIAWWPKSYLGIGFKYFGILACIGISMLLTLALSRPAWVLAASLACFAASQFTPITIPAAHPFIQSLAIITYAPNLYPGLPMTSLFPVLHWFGFMGLGYCFGAVTHQKSLSEHKLTLFRVGLGLMALAFAVRYLNGFGNRLHWAGSPFDSAFFILSKYPPSGVYVLFTCGALAALLALAIHSEGWLKESNLAQPLILFGQTSLFFYLAHLFLYGMVSYFAGQHVLVGIYQTWTIWLAGLVPLYFACCSYRELKARYPHSFLKYV